LNRHEQGLAERRRELVERSSAQRKALAAAAEPLVRKSAALDRVIAQVRRYPVVASVAVGALALLGPRRLFDLAARAAALYALLRR
jgi:hypothetical protein